MLSLFSNDLKVEMNKYQGISSVNIDMGHYGGSSSGSCTLFFRFSEDRQSTYYCSADWQGGLYITPTMFGSRNSGYQVASWLAIMSHGIKGY